MTPFSLALGTDLAPVSRIRELFGGEPGVTERVFTTRELDYWRAHRRAEEHLAARFAAKEAVFKALGTGQGPSMRWTDVEVVNQRGGRPQVRLHGAAARAAQLLGAGEIELSLFHAGGLAIACAAFLKEAR